MTKEQLKQARDKVTRYGARVFAWGSQGINCVLFFGHHDQTISARSYVQRRDRHWYIAYRVFNAMYFWQKNHCRSSHARDQRFARKVLAWPLDPEDEL